MVCMKGRQIVKPKPWSGCRSSERARTSGRLTRGRKPPQGSAVVAAQTHSGVGPHINYEADPGPYQYFCGVPVVSTITQPPLYGHAPAVFARTVLDIDELSGRVTAAFRCLLVALPIEAVDD
jgi:hypothetical protein